MPAASTPTPEEARQKAAALVGEAVGELIEFWGFRRSMGVVWACLYLSAAPLTQEEILERTGLSAGSVSMTLAELERWGVVRREPMTGERKKHYGAETDIHAMIMRVFRERELRKVQDMVHHLEDALRLVRLHGASSHASDMMRTQFVVTRIESLLQLARIGEKLLSRLAEIGLLDFRALKSFATRGS